MNYNFIFKMSLLTNLLKQYYKDHKQLSPVVSASFGLSFNNYSVESAPTEKQFNELYKKYWEILQKENGTELLETAYKNKQLRIILGSNFKWVKFISDFV